MATVTCPRGHSGPWRFVEAIEVWRDVADADSDAIAVHSRWRTGEGYDEGVPGSAYLLCWAQDSTGARCESRVDIPPSAAIDWM